MLTLFPPQVSAAKKAKRALTVEEQKQVDHVTAVVNRIVQVDAFDKLGAERFEADDFVRPALRHTKFAAPISVSAATGKAQRVANAGCAGSDTRILALKRPLSAS